MEAIYRSFSNRELRMMETSAISQPVYTSPLRRSKLPIVSSSPQSGSISSGQPVIQVSPQKAEPQPTHVSLVVAESTKPKTTLAFPPLSVGSTVNVNESPKMQSTFGNKISINSPMPSSNAQVGTLAASSFSTTPAASVFKLTSNATQPNIFATSSTTANKFSFSSLASQTTSAFSSPTVFGSNTGTFQSPVSSAPQTFAVPAAKPFTFSLAVTTASASAPTTSTTTSEKGESPKSAIPFNIAPPETATSVSSTSAPQSPLASLSSFVFAIEKPNSESPNKFKASSDMAKTSQTQPFTFKVPSSSENKVSPKTNLFGSNTENKKDTKELSSASDQKENGGEAKTIFGGGFKALSFESTPQKSFFGGTSFSSDSATTKPNQVSKNLFTFTNTSPNPFGTSTTLTTTSHSTSSSAFVGAVSLSSNVADSNRQREVSNVGTVKTNPASPIIEVSLSPPKGTVDPKTTLEKLSASKGITVTKLGSPEEKDSSTSVSLSGPDTTTSAMFGSLNVDSFTTPTKSSIFGGSPPVKPSVIYEVTTPENQTEIIPLENKVASTSSSREKLTDKPPEDLSAKISENKNAPVATTFTFTIPTETSLPLSAPGTQTEQNPGFTFDLKGATPTISSSTTSAATTTQAASAFSFNQAVSQPSSTAFTFVLTTTSTPTTASSTFGFGGLTSFSDEKSKSTAGFSFGQPTQNAASTGMSIFGGFGSKPVETTSVFGQSTTTISENKISFGSPTVTSENKSVFGQTPPLATEAKSVFGQPQATTAETKNIFGQVSANDTKGIFGQTPSTLSETNFGQSTASIAETKSIFGQPPASTAETKSIFGQPPASTAETKSIFGQPPASTAETKSIFGQPPASTAETKGIFGQTPASTAETKSIFGQPPASTAETKSIFGQPPASTAETKSIFGQPSASTAETKSIFGQPPASTAETKSMFGQTPTSTAETKSVFGQTPATATETNSVFGQPITTPGTEKIIDFSFSLSSLTTNTTQSSPFFNNPTTTSQTSFFGQPVCSPNSSAGGSPFGQPTTSVFGGPTAAAASPFGSKPAFGQSVGSFFGQSSGNGFGSSGGSVFGGSAASGGSGSVFGGASSQPSSPFGQSTGGGGSLFGGGSFSGGGGQSVGQTGFGTAAPAFQNKPAAFGSASPPAFGGAPAFGTAPTFGGAPAFGSSPKMFGSPASPATPAPAFGASPQQQSPTFENLASQNTMTFGNLAQNQPATFGSVFSSPQNTQPPPAFPPASTNSVFGGSSFSSWR